MMGELVPTACIDVLPGDRLTISVENFLRFAPLIAPINAVVEVTTWWFFTPDRILFEDVRDWEDWITDVQTAQVYPWVGNVGGDNTGNLLDHLYGIQSKPNTIQLTAAPIAAYTKIWDDWFRNQNITTTERHVPLFYGDNDWEDILRDRPFKRAWKKDYFTSALPWAQKGSEVTLPLLESGTAIVENSGTLGNPVWRKVSDGTAFTPAGPGILSVGINSNAGETESDGTEIYYDPLGTLDVDINAAASTINELRAAYRLQEFLELNAMAGTRYTELIYGHFGVKSPDARLQRPELLGIWKGRMAISEVLQTSAAHDDASTGIGTPLGTMGGHGISVTGGKPISYFASEHGWIMGIINVQPVPVYQQGLARKYSKLLPIDRFWPKLAHIGEQEILMQEIYTDAADVTATFGYTPRYAEYRFEQNRVAGEMRTILAHWHLGRIFDSEPALNEDFVYCDPAARIFNVLYTGGGEEEYSGDQIFGMIHNNIYASRLIPKYGRPTL